MSHKWWEASSGGLGFWGTVAATIAAAVAIAGGAALWTRVSLKLLWGWLTHAVPVPLVLLVLLLAVSMTFLVSAVLRTFAAGVARLPWLDYREDRWLGLVWRWDYHSDGQLMVDSLDAFCPACGTRLKHWSDGYRDFVTTFSCVSCSFRTELKGNEPEVIDTVLRKLERKLRACVGKAD